MSASAQPYSSNPSGSRNVLGVDIGGTKLAVGVATPDGKLLAQDRIPTSPEDGMEVVLNRLVELCRRVIARSGQPIAAVGVGSVGPLDQKTGYIINPVNLKGWGRVPLVDTIRAGLNSPVFLDNDANAAALGEHRFGAGQGVANMIYLTISTGVGGGIIIDHALYQGENGNAGEVGHMSVDYHGRPCGCGNVGCIEQYASGPAIVRRMREALDAPGAPRSPLHAAGELTPQAVIEAAERGDALARKVWDDTILALGTALASFIHIFNPKRIVIGGGVSKAGDKLFIPLREATKKRTVPPMWDVVEIVPARLGDDVGIFGAIAVGLDGYARAAQR